MAGNFEMIYFSPVGFICPKYLNDNCLFCKGKLADPCVLCVEKNICLVAKTCDINAQENMHIHCQDILEKNTTD